LILNISTISQNNEGQRKFAVRFGADADMSSVVYLARPVPAGSTNTLVCNVEAREAGPVDEG